jgi:DNA-binding transcriptional MerR regulator
MKGVMVFMNYTIKSISKLLNVSEEQVRRWCRSGQLKSLKHSRKEGYVIEKCDLFAFLDDNPKYRNALDLESDDNALKILKICFLETQLDDMKKEIVELENTIKALKGSE